MIDRLRATEAAHDDLAAILAPSLFDGRTLPLMIHARNRASDARRGYPGAAAYDAPHVDTSPDGSPPPPGADLDGYLDAAAADLASWDRVIRVVEAGAAELLRLTQRWQPRHPDIEDQRKVRADNERVPECAHCASHGYRHVPPRSSTDCAQVRADGTVAAKLPAVLVLCRWCQDAYDAVHRLPTGDELDRHHAGVLVRWSAAERYRARLAMVVNESVVAVQRDTWTSNGVMN